MKAIFIKELRENVKWAALMFVAAAIALGAALSTNNARYHSTIGGFTFPLFTGLGFPAIGFALGLLQILQDSSPGRWGFLTHRPISRSHILWGKILAGMCLYFLATLVPLAVAEYWIARPGHASAPYVWQMELPRLADAIGGLMWYAAGLLVGARQARWIGSRLMPVGMALVGSFAAYGFPLTMGHALLIIVAVVALILPAAWAAFTSSENFERQPIIAKLAAGVCVIVGIGCALGALAGFSSSMLRSFAGPERDFDYTYYQIAGNGRIVIVRASSRKGPVSTTDLQGNPLADKLAPGNSSRVGISLADKDPRYMSVGFQRETKYLRDLGYIESEHWYYVVPRKTIEGFNTTTDEFVGSLGPGGFVAANQNPQPFQEPLQVSFYSGTGTTVLASSRTAYQIDLSQRTIVPMFVAESGDEILAASGSARSHSDGTSVPIALIVTRKAVYFFESGKERFRTALKRTLPELRSLEVCPTPDGKYVLGYLNSSVEKDPWAWVDEIDGQGRLVRETTLPQLPMPGSPQSSWVDLPVIAIMPPALDIWALLWTRAQSQPNPFGQGGLIVAIVLAVLVICSTVFLAGRMGFSRRAKWGWSFLNTLLGCTGLLLLPSLFARIARVPCPACKKPRLVTRELCEHCNAPFSPPAAEGIEIFPSGSDRG